MRNVDWLSRLRRGFVTGSIRRRNRVSSRIEALETRVVLVDDFGDAPDANVATGPGNYQTVLASGGPRHTVVAGLFLGATVDGEANAAQNAGANGDDIATDPDDEDGVVNPLVDLVLTVGTQPTITLQATNTLATTATLSGWIDYNNDGVFNNSTERALAIVQPGSTNVLTTLVFPVIPTGFTGTSYARFRLGTEAVVLNSVGAATNGEVEDYQVTINGPSSGTVETSGATKLADGGTNMPTLANTDYFGNSVVSIGDLDGDGIGDVVVGAPNDDTGGTDRGAVYILRLNSSGGVKSGGVTKLASGGTNMPTLADTDLFGESVASLGDFDGDGVVDILVGADGDGTGSANAGAVYLLRLTASGTVKTGGVTKIASGTNGGPTLGTANFFGNAVAAVGDINGDGVGDIAVGAPFDDTGATNRGAVYVFRLNATGAVAGTTVISGTSAPTLAASDYFGSSLAFLGDLDGDGVGELAVGATGDDTGGAGRGAVHVLRLNPDGSMKGSTKIANGTGGGPTLANNDNFGQSVAFIGDVDGDGVGDLAVGAHQDDTGAAGGNRGAVYVVRLNVDGTAKGSTKIANATGGGPTLVNSDQFGRSVAFLGDIDGDGRGDLAVGAVGDDGAGTSRGAIHLLRLDTTTALSDFGDAPDTGPGTGTKNYETLTASGGPSHGIVNGLLLGARISGEADASPNNPSNGDDIGTDDEDGVLNPQADFLLTAGTQPTVSLSATNTTGTAATLTGWIDYNGNGVFDNTTERAQIAVPAGTNRGTFTLTFPSVPTGFVGTTYARFRLSTDSAAANPNGAASDGEVEDYAVSITIASTETVKTGGLTKLASGGTNVPTLADADRFGAAVANLGDLDGDGVADLAVSATGDDTGGADRGAVHILFMNADRTIKSSSKIASGVGGGPTLVNGDGFGKSVANIGDLDSDGVTDLAVGADLDDTGGASNGAVYILFLNANGTAKSTTKIARSTNGGSTQIGGFFGTSVTAIGDLNSDGITDLAVGATGDSTGGLGRGAVHVLLMNPSGTVQSSVRIASGANGGPALADNDNLGNSIANLGDLDGDGVVDIVVGAGADDTGGANRGAVHVLFLNSDGTAKSTAKIASGTGGGPTLANTDVFGISVANVGDLNGDGVTDIAVGAKFDDTGGAGTNRGALYLLNLNAAGTAVSSSKIANALNGGPLIGVGEAFGVSVANLGDIDGDGAADLIVGGYNESTGGSQRGAVHLLQLGALNHAPTALNLSSNSVAENAASGTTVGTLLGVDQDVPTTFTFSLVSGSGSTDNASFTITGNSLKTNAVFDFETKSTFEIRIRATDQGGLFTEQSIPITVTNTNDAPVLDNSGNPFAILGVGSRQSLEMRQGVLVSDIPARSGVPNPIADQDAGATIGIAVIDVDRSLGSLQFTLVSNNPQESDWQNIEAAGQVSNSSALLLPVTARVRFNTGLIPHHAVGAPFLPLESKLDTALTFRAWDGTTGVAGGRGDATANGGTTPFSTTTETVKAYFEARLFRTFNTNAQLNVYTLEAEFNALTANPALVDRSTSAFTGFTVLMSPVPELGTAAVFRMLFGVQFNDDGTETDMGYRYLTTNAGEADILEGLGPVAKRPQRDGTYFREIGDPANPADTGVNNRTGILGYIFTTQQPGTLELTQVYRTDLFPKPTRPGGTPVGSTPTSTRNQEQGDHVYTTNIPFETSRPGTWRVEASRGFARELTPAPTGGPPPAAMAEIASSVQGTSGEARRRTGAVAVLARSDEVALSPAVDVARLVAIPYVERRAITLAGAIHVGEDISLERDGESPFGELALGDSEDGTSTAASLDGLFGDLELLAACESAW